MSCRVDRALRVAEATEKLHEACKRFKAAREAQGLPTRDLEGEWTRIAQDCADHTQTPVHLSLLRFAALANAMAERLE